MSVVHLKNRWSIVVGALAVVSAAQASAVKASETVWLLTDHHELIKVQADQPNRIQDRKAITGLPKGASLVGIDYRVAYGTLFALSDHGHIYTIDTESGALTPVSAKQENVAIPVSGVTMLGRSYGFDFNPAADRIRVVNERRQNLRLHPETGALASTDPNLAYATSDRYAGHSPRIGAAAYTYNTKNEKLTTNFAIDLALGNLVLQGSREDAQPAVSPNDGVLFTVGPLGLGALTSASFDIADINNRALAAVRAAGSSQTRLYDIDLQSGKARALGVLANGKPLLGLAIQP